MWAQSSILFDGNFLTSIKSTQQFIYLLDLNHKLDKECHLKRKLHKNILIQ
jgi:hypothetical protein